MSDTVTAASELRYHRIRFYPERWSNFDSVELCGKPGSCVGCQFDHPLCDKNGRTVLRMANE